MLQLEHPWYAGSFCLFCRIYIKVAPFLPRKDTELSKTVLFHPDLHADNIFVNPDRPTEILSIIDWQAVNLSPLSSGAPSRPG